MTVRFSIAIPNFNYGHYLGETIESVLSQGDPDVEVVVSDNASTDNSVEVARAFDPERVKVFVNPTNVGFASNLDRAVGPTTGSHVILLSSDDVMRPGALRAYRRALESCADPADVVLSSTYDTIDENGRFVSCFAWPSGMAGSMKVDGGLSATVEAPVAVGDPQGILRWALTSVRNPLPFATVCFPRRRWEAIGGYTGARQVSPDKWFHWRLLATDPTLLMVDEPLFGYRVHGGGQTNAMRKVGALKQMVDQYAYTYEVPDEMLDFAGVDRRQLQQAFVRHDGSARSLALLAEGRQHDAKRYARFASAVYPSLAYRDLWWWAAALLSAMPFGRLLARAAIARQVSRSSALSEGTLDK